MTGEEIGYLMEKLFKMGGILDVYFTFVQMKKNRPGILLTVLVNKRATSSTIQWLLKNTTTFGVRYSTMKRVVLQRNFRQHDTKLGKMQFKYGYWNGELIKITQEYEDVKYLADKNQLSFYEANQLSKEYAHQLLRNGDSDETI